MADCRCGAKLAGRRRVCDDCKAAPKAKRQEPTPEPQDDLPEERPVRWTGPPAGLHSRGRELWESLGQVRGTAAGELALEACRMADRLNELDRIIAGKGVLQLMKFRLDLPWWDGDGEQHVHVKVGFQSVLAEARHQQVALKDILKEMRAAIAATTASQPPAGSPPGPAVVTPPASGLDQLGARRAAREQATPGA